jgi:hypothetical protein
LIGGTSSTPVFGLFELFFFGLWFTGMWHKTGKKTEKVAKNPQTGS